MTSIISMPLVRHTGMFAAAILLAAGVTQAQQSTTSNDASAASSYSSSQSGVGQFQLAEVAAPATPASSAASPSGGAAGQYGTSGGGHRFHGMFHHWTFEAGLGGNAPTGQDTNESNVVIEGPIPVITWGGNFTLGGGLRLNDRFSVLGEYQFMDNKLPGVFISDVNNNTGGVDNITEGRTHINSITASPVYDLTPKRSNGIYVVGGAGWYHKSTSFETQVAQFDYYYGGYITQNVTVSSFSSNQLGANFGLGLYHRFSNVYGDTNHTEFFAEARYLYIHTPPATQQNGVGITELIPFTVGFRF
jgi:hypothetical protein